MEMVYYTITAILLYVISDYILNTIEVKMEKRLPNRSLVFFAIISILAVSSFSVIKVIYKGSDTVPVSNDTKPVQANDSQPVSQVQIPSSPTPQVIPAPTQANEPVIPQ